MTNQAKKVLWVFIIIASVFCSSCARYQQYQQEKQKEQQTYVEEAYHLAPFSSIVITGNAKVELAQGNISAIHFAGQKQYVDVINAYVSGNTLYINNQIPSAIPIKVQTANVTRNIAVANNSYLSANNIAVKKLNLSATNNASITLNGEFDVTNINQSGSGKIEMKWINSTNLKITGGSNGPIYLAGTVNNLTVRLFDSARLEARYLRAQKATILTTDQSRADVLASQTLSAFADRRSNILYYKRPQEFNKVSQDSGNVLLIEELR